MTLKKYENIYIKNTIYLNEYYNIKIPYCTKIFKIQHVFHVSQLGVICGLYLKSASSGIAILSQITALRSCSCPVLSLHSPRVTREDDRRCDPDGSHRPPTSVLLRTPSMQRDHTARLSMPGPFISTNITTRLFIHVKYKKQNKKTLNIFSSSSTNTHTPYQMVPTVIWSSCAPQGSVDSTSANGQGQRSHCCSIMLPVSQTAAHTTPAAAPPQAGEGIKTRMKNKMN